MLGIPGEAVDGAATAVYENKELLLAICFVHQSVNPSTILQELAQVQGLAATREKRMSPDRRHVRPQQYADEHA
jgi:hypothetical protein